MGGCFSTGCLFIEHLVLLQKGPVGGGGVEKQWRKGQCPHPPFSKLQGRPGTRA